MSPAVNTLEQDLSFVPAGLAQIGGAIIGLTQKGPAFQPMQVTSYGDFVSKFGGKNPKLFVPYTAEQYLRNSSILNVVRVLGTNTSVDVGTALILAFPANGSSANTALASSNTALAVLRARGALSQVGISGTSNNFTLVVNSATVDNLSLDKASPNYIKKLLGTDPFSVRSGDVLTGVYVESTFDYSYFASGALTGQPTSVPVSANTNYSSGVGGFTNAQTPIIVSQNYNGAVYDLFKFDTLGDGNNENTNIKVSIDVQSSQIGVSSYPTFVVSVRSYSSTDVQGGVLETFTVNLDPTSQAYILKVIGDRSKTFNTAVDPPEVVYNGTYDNKSKYIRVTLYEGYPADARPSGFKGVPAMQAGPVFLLPTKNNHLGNSGSLDPRIYMGFDSTKDSAADRLGFLVTGISAATTNIAKGFLLTASATEYSAAAASTASLTSNYNIYDVSVSGALSASTYNKIALTVPFYGGWDGIDERKDLTQIINDGTLSSDFINAIKILANPDEIDFNLLTIPGVYAGIATNGSVPQRAIEMVETRGDAFYIMDMGTSEITTTTGTIMNLTVNQIAETAKGFDTSYAGSYYPAQRIQDSENGVSVWVPPSVVMMGAFSFNDRVSQPWFAPAGFNRGVLNSIEARKRLTSSQRDTLHLANINAIGTFVGQGIVAFGQNTLQIKASALDKINVRRLLIYAKKLIASVARFFLFENNTTATRTNLLNAINPILERIQRLQGLTAFRVIIDDTVNTQADIDNNRLNGVIQLMPARSIETINLTFSILPSGTVLFES